MKKENQHLTMKEIADKYKRGWSFIDNGKGVILRKKKKNKEK